MNTPIQHALFENIPYSTSLKCVKLLLSHGATFHKETVSSIVKTGYANIRYQKKDTLLQKPVVELLRDYGAQIDYKAMGHIWYHRPESVEQIIDVFNPSPKELKDMLYSAYSICLRRDLHHEEVAKSIAMIYSKGARLNDEDNLNIKRIFAKYRIRIPEPEPEPEIQLLEDIDIDECQPLLIQ